MSLEFEKAYLFTGVNGVGKSTLLRGICKKEPEKFLLFPGSLRLMEKLGLRVGDYDSLRKLPEDFKIKAWNDLMLDILEQRRESTGVVLLIDAHLYHYKQGEMVEDPTEWMKGLDGIFLVSTDVNSLNLRISKDEKSRDLLPEGLKEDERIKMLAYFLDATQKRASEIARQYGIPFYSIQNLEDGLEVAVQDFLRIYRGEQK